MNLDNKRHSKIRVCAIALVALIAALNLFSFEPVALADEAGPRHVEVGIREKLGQRIPMDLAFTDENGKPITLKRISDGKPLIIDMAYYECPGICDVVMGDLARILNEFPQAVGKDFNVATISFNPIDKPADAMKKKEQFFGELSRPLPARAWRFLTGDSASIYSLTNSMGFYFMRDKYGMFTHPTALIIVDKNGKIIRYLQGTKFRYVNVKMALLEASAGTPEQIIDSTPKVCFSHDPAGNKFADAALQFGGVGTLVLLAGFLVYLNSRKKPGKNQGAKN